MQQQQQPIDLQNTEQVFGEDGGVLFKQGFILRKVSKFITGTPEDSIMTIPVFYDPITKKILESSVPPDIREDLQDFYSEEKKED